MSTKVFIGLGSNLGNRSFHLNEALTFMTRDRHLVHSKVTSFLETPPWGVVDQPPFLNAIAQMQTRISPHALLALLKQIEVEMGRDLTAMRWGPRVIDLDILLYGDQLIDSADLVIPHPRIVERDFVLQQLLELDPNLTHPRSGRPLSSYLQERVTRES